MSEATDGDVLVVIPCFNEARHLPALLAGLLREAGGALVVVADGGSTDDSRAIVARLARRHANLVLLDNRRRIQSAAVNLAARRFGHGRRWLVRVDAHALYPDGYIARLKRAAQETAATSVVVPMVSRGVTCFQNAAAAAQNSVLGTGGSPHRHPGAGRWVEHGHHALFDLQLYMAAGGYDETFAANEDAELDRRLVALGGRLWLEPAAAITYFPRSGLGSLFRQYLRYGVGRARNLRRHPAPMQLRQILPLSVAPSLVLALTGMALSAAWRPALLLSVPAACWLVLTLAAGLVLGLRARTRCAMAAGVAAAAMHAGWSLGYFQAWLLDGALPPAPMPLTLGDRAIDA